MRTIDFNLTLMLRVKNATVCHLKYFNEKVVEIFYINERSHLINEEKEQNLWNLHLLFLGDCYTWCATFLFLPHFDIINDLLLNRRTATWNLFVKYIMHWLVQYFRALQSIPDPRRQGKIPNSDVAKRIIMLYRSRGGELLNIQICCSYGTL